MTTLQNTTIRDIISKTSFKQGSLEAELLITLMASGFNFIQSIRMAKKLTNES